jgi:hypothetical protein
MRILIKKLQYNKPVAIVGITIYNLMSNLLDRLIDIWVLPDIFMVMEFFPIHPENEYPDEKVPIQ